MSVWRGSAGIGACLLLAWFPFTRGTRVPLLGLVDLGFHELGHLLTYPLPEVITAVMGSVAQVAVPIALAAYFLLARHDRVAAGICLAWAAASAVDVSVYVADAPYQRLPLIGGEHDWAFLLGPVHLDLLESAHRVAGVVKGFGVALLLAGLACCAWDLTPRLRGHRSRPNASSPGPASVDDMWL